MKPQKEDKNKGYPDKIDDKLDYEEIPKKVTNSKDKKQK